MLLYYISALPLSNQNAWSKLTVVSTTLRLEANHKKYLRKSLYHQRQTRVKNRNYTNKSNATKNVEENKNKDKSSDKEGKKRWTTGTMDWEC